MMELPPKPVISTEGSACIAAFDRQACKPEVQTYVSYFEYFT
jgi:hypothetical protein